MITMFFGSPGCGKSTLLTRIALQAWKSGEYDHVFSNVETKVTQLIDIRQLDSFTLPQRSLILIDEAGICYNNRNFKSFSSGTIEFFKMHRHEECDICLFSQSWEDVDITIRRLTVRLFHLKAIGPLTLIKRVYKKVGIDDNSHQIIDEYRFGHILGNLTFAHNIGYIWRPFYYRYFDSYTPLKRPCLQVGIFRPSDKDYRRYVIMRVIYRTVKFILIAVIILLLLGLF